jgi:hypothetical protein
MINFICDPCKTGADVKGTDYLAMVTKKDWHMKCKGDTHCDCQHRYDRKNVQ